ncbi:MAG: Fe-S cluster assembly protein SufD [Myxococcota bacterium]
MTRATPLADGGDRTALAAALPGPKDEAWKYTRAAAYLATPYPVAEITPVDVAAIDADVVFVDGWRVRSNAPPELAIRDVNAVSPMGEARGIEALHRAYARDGLYLHLGADRAAKLTIVHRSTGSGHGSAVRHVVEVEPGARLELHETFDGDGPGMSLGWLEVRVGAGGELVHVRSQSDGGGAVHHGLLRVTLGEGARYHGLSVLGGAAVARVDATVTLAGAGAKAELFGLTLVRGTEHADHHLTIDHAAPGGTSSQVFRALATDRGRSVFTGKVEVRPAAVKTDASQVHRALLLSDGAVINARPQLEIRTDDVRCSHGAAIGALDDESLFYLRQRGLDALEARALLTVAFASDVVAAAPDGPVRAQLTDRVARWLGVS